MEEPDWSPQTLKVYFDTIMALDDKWQQRLRVEQKLSNEQRWKAQEAALEKSERASEEPRRSVQQTKEEVAAVKGDVVRLGSFVDQSKGTTQQTTSRKESTFAIIAACCAIGALLISMLGFGATILFYVLSH